MGKLLSYEFRNTRKTFIQLLLIMLGATFILQFVGFNIVSTGMVIEYLDETRFGNVYAIGFLFGIIFFIISIITFIAYYLRIGSILKSDIYEDKSYFLFSIPHTGYQIIGAKTIVAFIWANILPIIMFIWNSLLVLINMSLVEARYSEVNFATSFKNSIDAIVELISQFNIFEHFSIGDLILMFTSSLVQEFLYILIVFASILIAYKLGRRNKNSGAWVLISVALIAFHAYLVSTLIMPASPAVTNSYSYVAGNVTEMFSVYTLPGLLFNLALTILIFIYTSYTFEKRIEI